MKERKPGTTQEGRIPIFDHKGHARGHVTPHATSMTVARFIGLHGAKLGTKDGRQAWIGPKPPPPKPPTADPTAVAVAKEQAKGIAKSGAATQNSPSAKQTLEISLKTAKGSVSEPAAAKKPAAKAAKPAEKKK